MSAPDDNRLGWWVLIPALFFAWFGSILTLLGCGIAALFGAHAGNVAWWAFIVFCACPVLLSPITLPFALSVSFTRPNPNGDQHG